MEGVHGGQARSETVCRESRPQVTMTGPIDVVGIGNAIVDVLSQANDDFLASRGLAAAVQ